ncbi:MAG: Dihydroorotate dehydrogenase (quinone) [Acidobacteria bacterium]|nr:Dihydroorotate dehydrogenase (quinone) [Acidobacteriota bacterium]
MLYRTLLRPILFRLPPETAHELALHSLPLVLGTRLARDFVGGRCQRSCFGDLQRLGLSFKNPVGLAAGFDKNGIALEALATIGFGHIEAGTVTYQSQPGNQRPRLFRLPRDQALINRAGFNNDGAEAFAARVSKHRPDCVLGVSIGKSRAATNDEAVADYLKCFEIVYAVADYIAVNVSSPNTPGLRDLQKAEQLEMLLSALQQRNQELVERTARPQLMPLLIKLAPDLQSRELELIVDVAKRTHIAGIIATNTTIDREGLQTAPERVAACGAGGLSGAPLRARSTQIIANLFQLSGGSMNIIGVGGIFTAEDAWEKICAGAGLVQLYTGFIYEGPAVVRDINDGLAAIVKRDGFASLDEAIGSRAKELAGAG